MTRIKMHLGSKVWLYALGLLVLQLYLPIKAGDDALTFDSPFPKTGIERAVNTGMELWGNLQFLCGTQGENLSQYDRDRLVKVSVGNAAYIKELAGSVRPAMSNDDSMYVAGIIDRAIHACPDTPRHHINDDRFSCLQSLLRKAYNRFSGTPSLFKGDHTVIRTGE